MSTDDEEAPETGRSSVWRIVSRWLKRIVIACLVVVALGAVGLWFVLRHFEKDLPSTTELRNYHPPQVTRVMARDGSLLAELFTQRRTVVSIDEIPEDMKIAVLAAEDADFYNHEGLDYLGMLRALWVNVRSQKARQGGSTITQQVVKNVLLTPERTFERKARELLLARRIEQEFSKDEILELYLNHIYFGHGRYGVEEAARYYFGKGIGDVTLEEAAMLAALPKGPGIYSPRLNYERALGRRDAVLDQIAAKHFTGAERVERAKARPIVLAPALEALPELAPEVIDEVRRTLTELVGPSAARGGFTVHTTIDPELQASARRALRTNLDAYAKRHGLAGPLPGKGMKKLKPFQGTPSAKGHHVYHAVVTGSDQENLLVRIGSIDGRVKLAPDSRYNPQGLPPSKFAKKGTVVRVSALLERGLGADGIPRDYRLELAPQSALVAIDVRSREILAIVGSYEGLRGRLDRATFAHRQPGSTFKPFVYSYGLHSRRLTPATLVPIERDKPLLLREAVARSINEAATWALNDVGAESVVSWAQALGIESKLAPTESLALGAYEVTPRELASAYGSFASYGVYEKPRLIRRVVTPEGKDIKLPEQPPARRVMAEDEAYLMTNVLRSVVRYGTGRKANELKTPIAGKTGTSNDARDAWFAGFSTDIVCVVWTGYDDNIPLGKGEYGAKAALPAFIEFMKAAHANRKPQEFPRPAGLIDVRIDPGTGLLAYPEQEDAIEEIFLAGTEPQDEAEEPDAGAGGAGGAGGGDGSGGAASDAGEGGRRGNSGSGQGERGPGAREGAGGARPSNPGDNPDSKPPAPADDPPATPEPTLPPPEPTKPPAVDPGGPPPF